MTNVAAKTDAIKTDAAKMIPAAAQTDTAKMTFIVIWISHHQHR